eukprot:1291430-Prymnesium_polylepis.1
MSVWGNRSVGAAQCEVLALVADRPAIDGIPCGWAAVGTHVVDDGIGVVSSLAMRDHIEKTIGADWAMSIGG